MMLLGDAEEFDAWTSGNGRNVDTDVDLSVNFSSTLILGH